MTEGNVLVTGGSGFLGRHFAGHLREAGWAVRAIDVVPGPDVTPVDARAYFRGNGARNTQYDLVVHCFPRGTLVDAPVPVPIEEAHEVYGHDGRLHKVLDHSERPYNGPLVVLDSCGTLPLRCTPEHPVLVVRPWREPGGRRVLPNWSIRERTVRDYYANLRPEWVLAKDVRKGDFLVGPRSQDTGEAVLQPFRTRSHPNARPVGALEPDKETAWMLGSYAADGGTMGIRGIQFTTARVQDAERIAEVWRRYGLHPNVTDYGKYQRVKVASRAVSEAFAEWFGRSDNKRLPPFIFDGWPLDAILQGVVDGDGYVDRLGRVCITTISPVLARQLHMILRSLGEAPTARALHRYPGFGYPNGKQGWAVRWSPPRKRQANTWWRGYYLMPVRTVTEEQYEGTVCNLEVADAHTYAVGGAVVHNCAAVVGGRHRIENDPLALAVNLELDAGLFSWARKARPGRIVYFSSSAAYPTSFQREPGYKLREDDIDPDHPQAPDGLYGWAKLTGEYLARLARADGQAVTVVRPFSGYGSDQGEEYPVGAMAGRAARREDPFLIWGDGTQVRDFVHIDDIVATVMEMARLEHNGPLNLGWGTPVTMGELAAMFARAAGYSPAFETVPAAPSGVRWRVCQPARLWDVRLPRVPLEQGISEALEYRMRAMTSA